MRIFGWSGFHPRGQSLSACSHYHHGRSKYIVQRWYFYKEDPFQFERQAPPRMPERLPYQHTISCDDTEHGGTSCRLYDTYPFA